MQERIESYQPAKGRCRSVRIQPVHAKLRRLLLQQVIDAIGNHFNFDAGATRLVYTGAELLGAIAARVPGFEIKVRRGAGFHRSEVSWRNQARELGAGGHECDDAFLSFCERRELARQLCHVFQRR